jgi:hypothetical protein
MNCNRLSLGALLLVLAASLAGMAMTVRGTLSLTPHLPQAHFELIASDALGSPTAARAWIRLPGTPEAF